MSILRKLICVWKFFQDRIVAGRFEVVEASYWFPIGTVEQWTAAQTADVSPAG